MISWLVFQNRQRILQCILSEGVQGQGQNFYCFVTNSKSSRRIFPSFTKQRSLGRLKSGRDGDEPGGKEGRNSTFKKETYLSLTWGNFCVHPFQTLLACLWADLAIARWWFWACTYPRCRCLKSCTVGWWEFPQQVWKHKMAGPAEPEPPKRARGRCGMINSLSRVLSLDSWC